MPNQNLIKNLTENFQKSGFELYLVGGAVRDQLLNKTPAEFDLTTNAEPPKIKSILQSMKPTDIYDIGEKFGTIGAHFDSTAVEITTYRGETYTEGSRHPQVVFGKSLQDDLSRRDFTINAIAFDAEKQAYIDPFHGQSDISNKLIRVVGESVTRFHEDPLRLLRAIRFAVCLDFEIHPTTASFIKEAAPELASISPERIAQEMDKILLSNKPSRGIRLLTKLNLLPYILPEFLPLQNLQHEADEHKDIYEHTLQVLDYTDPTKRLRWLALLHDIAKPETKSKTNGEIHFLGHEVKGERTAQNILRRLHYDRQFIHEVSKLIRLHLRVNLYDYNWTDGAVKRLALETGDLLDDLIKFSYADITSKREEKVYRAHQKIDKFKTRLKEIEAKEEIAKIKSPLSGEDLMQIFNQPPGPWIKPVKQYLTDLVIDGELAQDDKTQAEKLARKFLEKK